MPPCHTSRAAITLIGDAAVTATDPSGLAGDLVDEVLARAANRFGGETS